MKKKELKLLKKIYSGASIFRTFKFKKDQLILNEYPYKEYVDRDLVNKLMHKGYLRYDNLLVTEKGVSTLFENEHE